MARWFWPTLMGPLMGLLLPLALLACANVAPLEPAAAPSAVGSTEDTVEPMVGPAPTPTDTAVNRKEMDSMMNHEATIQSLIQHFDPLPEQQVSVSEDRRVYAQYAGPTERYAHGILGDAIEAGQLVVVRDAVVYTHTLGSEYVFEDLRPRLVDVDGDGAVELVTIRSHEARGAGIMIYKIGDDALTEWAWVEEIGSPFRWLNIAAIYDLDGDGAMELAWIQTPHIGGILRVARVAPGKLPVLAEASLYSNHAIGERNLCLSVVSQAVVPQTVVSQTVVAQAGIAQAEITFRDLPMLYVPSQDRSQIVGFQLVDDVLHKAETIEQPVDFSLPLASQHAFEGVVQGGADCVP